MTGTWRKLINSFRTYRNRYLLSGVLLLFLIWFWQCLPEPLFSRPTSFVIESVEGELLGASIARDGQWRFPLDDTIPDKFVKCILAFEDKRFRSHPGIDILAMARAIRSNIRAGKTVSGGSTLSMQTIRLATGKKRTFANKLLEVLLTLRLELGNSKEEILSLYAANAPFGSNVVGLEAASWRYFGRSPDLLSWGETASLAVLPNSPALVHPGKNRNLLLAKRNRLISILEKQHILNASEAKMAKLEPIPEIPYAIPRLAPHLLNLVRNNYKKGILKNSRVRSSLRKDLQKQVASILDSHHPRLLANQVNNLAALVVDVETGQALAYNGNIFIPNDPEMESYVDMIQAPRSPGSVLKPLLFASMLNEGMILPHSLIPDVPTQISGYQPHNYDLGYDGAVPASEALARSLNVPAVKMLQQYRYEKFHGFLKGLGVSTLTNPPDFYGLSLILGGCETTLWELAGIYTSMARSLNHYNENGQYLEADWHSPTYLSDSTLKRGKNSQTEKQGKLNASAIYSTFEAMSEVMRPGEELVWKQFSSSQRIAWKTGTSFGYRDGWAIGLNAKYLVAVWAGNADGEGRPGLTGIEAAAPVLFDIFNLLPNKSNSWFSAPRGDFALIDVCTASGFRASEICSPHQLIQTPKIGIRSPQCPYHRLIHLDKSEQWQVTNDCISPSSMVHKSWFVLPPTMEYYFKSRNYSYKVVPPFKSDCFSEARGPVIELIYPLNNAKLYIPLELDGQRGRLIFKAVHSNPGETIYWHLDDRFVGETRELHQIELFAAAGKHSITLLDNAGTRITQAFYVISKE